MSQAALLFLHALSPLHAGTGQGIGAIDLPIAREKATNIPYLPGSSLKGVLRDRASDWHKDTLFAVFGPDTESASEHAGAVQVGDAKLLLLPVRSLCGVFALVTSPYLLERFRREAGMVGLQVPGVPGVPDPTPRPSWPPGPGCGNPGGRSTSRTWTSRPGRRRGPGPGRTGLPSASRPR